MDSLNQLQTPSQKQKHFFVRGETKITNVTALPHTMLHNDSGSVSFQPLAIIISPQIWRNQAPCSIGLKISMRKEERGKRRGREDFTFPSRAHKILFLSHSRSLSLSPTLARKRRPGKWWENVSAFCAGNLGSRRLGRLSDYSGSFSPAENALPRPTQVDKK